MTIEQQCPTGHIHKVAHDSGDGMTVYHCPFCGSGQVVARSDRTIECEFCHQAFTVQVQPMFPAFPQTVDGAPVEVPGMPGEVAPSGMEDPALDPNADPGAEPPMDPSMIGDDGDVEDEEDPSAEGGDDEEEDDDSGDDKNENPFAKKKSYRTASGQPVDEDDFLRHVAVVASGRDPGVLARVKASRG